MLNKIKEAVKNSLGWRASVQPAPEDEAKFLLKLDDLLIGTLTAKDGYWEFEYSDEFRRQDRLRPIVEMPDVNQVHRSKNLWQFFAMRIPSLEQPEVEKILEREHIREDDAVRLLERFGKRTIANPFELETAA